MFCTCQGFPFDFPYMYDSLHDAWERSIRWLCWPRMFLWIWLEVLGACLVVKVRSLKPTKDSYSTCAKQYPLWRSSSTLSQRSHWQVLISLKASLERGLSWSTINSSIVAAVADLYRSDDDLMSRGALVTQVKKVVKENIPAPIQTKPLEMELPLYMFEIISWSYLWLFVRCHAWVYGRCLVPVS